MKFVQDTMGWKELDDSGHIIGHMTHYQRYVYEQALNNQVAHEWLTHFSFWFQKDTVVDWEYLLHSTVGVVIP